jgi:hypothetical protein
MFVFFCVEFVILFVVSHGFSHFVVVLRIGNILQEQQLRKELLVDSAKSFDRLLTLEKVLLLRV